MKAVGVEHLAAMLEQKFEFAEGEARKAVEVFFQVIADNLKTQKYVKIKGLGVFKLIEGEKQGMRQIVFTPEQMLKEVVNKPFSHFEPVTLNDGVELDSLYMEDTNDDDGGAGEMTFNEGLKDLEVVAKEVVEEKPKEGEQPSVQGTEEAVINQEQQSMRIKRREQSLKDKEERDGRMFFIIIVLIGILAVVLALVFLLAPEWIEKMVYGSVSPLKSLE